MNFSDFVKTLFSKTKRDLAYISTAALLLTGAIVVEKTFSPALWVRALLYFLPLAVLLAQQAEHAINSKKDSLNRHWILFAIGLLMFGSTFVRNSDPHLRDAAMTLFVYSFGIIITEAFTTAVRNPLRGKRSHLPVNTERNGRTETTSPKDLKIGDIIIIGNSETVPTDGRIVSGSSTFTSVTDKQSVRNLKEDDIVYAGYTNKGNDVRIEVIREFSESSTSIIIDATKYSDWPKTVKLAKGLCNYLILLALPAAVAIAIIIPMLAQWFILAFPRWLYRALMFAAIACCDTIAFCHPIAVTGSFTKMIRNDIVINKYNIFDRLTRLRSLLFDKNILRENTLTSNDVKALRKSGVKRIVMTSSEDESTTSETAKQLGIKEYHSDMQPEGKAKLVRHLLRHRKENTYLAIVDDNDYEMKTVRQTIVRIAMTQPNNSAAIENSNVAILDNDLSKISVAIKASKKLARINWCNLGVSVISKAILLCLAFLGLAPIWMLALTDICILTITSLNATRTLK